MQIEPRTHVYVAGLTPVKPRMRKHDLSSADQQCEKRHRGSPTGHAYDRGVALPVWGRHCRTKLGEEDNWRAPRSTIGRLAFIMGPIPDALTPSTGEDACLQRKLTAYDVW